MKLKLKFEPEAHQPVAEKFPPEAEKFSISPTEKSAANKLYRINFYFYEEQKYFHLIINKLILFVSADKVLMSELV